MRQETTKLYVKRARLFQRRLAEDILGRREALEAAVRVTGRITPFDQRQAGPMEPIVKGQSWGELWDYGWLHITGQVPGDWAGSAVAAHLNVAPEALIFAADGMPVYHLTRGSSFDRDFMKDLYPLHDRAEGGEAVDLWVRGASSHAWHVGPGEIIDLELAEVRKDVESLWIDVGVLLDLYKALDDATPRARRILRALGRADDVYRSDPARATRAAEELREVLDVPARPDDVTAIAVGHAHLDTGWLWPVSVSVGKTIRTFASQVRNIETFDGYVFGASQAQHYAFVKEHEPKLYARVAEMIADGRWEVQGGMWVEADCNLISGESMVRQFVHGKNFFKEEFGLDVRNLWLPDVFGYSANLPQILRRSGCEYFLTQKLSWNQFNDFPHTTFKWRGIDGSEVLAHFPPEDNYSSRLEPSGLIKAQRHFRESDVLDEFMCLFGPGDGGGGPKEEHLHRLGRVADLAGCPRVKPGRADAFFKRLSDRADKLETWVGELYLELHRGTLTTQAQVKKENRLLENLLQAVEMLSALLDPADWPREELDAIWKTVLRNQFHDILPGSSVKDVYAKTLAEYRDVTGQLEILLGRAATKLLSPDDGAVTLMNTTSYAGRRVVRMPAGWKGAGAVDAEGNVLAAQLDDEGLSVQVEVPALGLVTIRPGAEAAATVEEFSGDEWTLENDRVRYVFSADGRLVEAFDKEAGRDILAEGEAGNVLSLYEDMPAQWEAWDVDVYYQDQVPATARVKEQPRVRRGPVRQEIEFALAIGQSRIHQKARLEAGSKRLDFVTEVDWCEQRRMLRTAFAVDVMSDRATFDIQYGYVQRPTHSNNSWDMAQFEVAGQRYADLSQGDYGAALLNDCKYGYKVRGNVLDLNLLRSPKYPDREGQGFTDQGVHRFTYSFLPHVGDLVESDVLAEAALMNRPVRVLEGKPGGRLALPCRIESDGVSLEVLKRAEKSDQWVVRLVETLGRRSSATLRLDESVRELVETDLLEWHDDQAVEVSGRAELTFEPFEIRTCKLR